MAGRYVLRIDDVTPAMNWQAMDKLQQRADDLGVVAVIGVVPRCEDPSLGVGPDRVHFWDWVRQRRQAGWSVAQHGYRHVYDSASGGLLKRRPKSEFAGLDYEIQYQRLRRGKEVLVGHGVWDPVFMAPGHTFDESTIAALSSLSFTTITDGDGLYPYRLNGLVLVPQLSARPVRAPLGVWTICVHLNAMSERHLQRLEAFLDRHHSDFVPITQAAQIAAPAFLPSAGLRAVSRLVQSSVRGLRAAGQR